jgi:carboxyl-terminal processing protease
LVLSAVLGGIYGPSVRATASGTTDLQDSIKNFTKVLSIVQQEYALPVDTDHALYEGAIPGMMRVLDSNSTFFDPLPTL